MQCHRNKNSLTAKLARQYHPDVNNGNPEAEERFKEISEAYAVLSNEEKRRQYDAYGFTETPLTELILTAVFSEFGFGDIFDMFFGNSFGGGFRSGRGSRNRSRGSDIALETTIEFKDAAFGLKKEISYKVDIECEKCQGTGAANVEDITTCSVCNGTGQVRASRNTFLGSLITTSICINCSGKGKVVKNPCKKCSGSGYIHSKREITVDIPAGISDGDRLKLSGRGNSRGF